MEILNVYNFDVKKKDSLLILTSKDEKDPMTITFTRAGYHIDTPSYEVLFVGNDELCYFVKGVSLKKYRYVLPYTLEFKLKKKDDPCKNMYDLCKLMNEVKKGAMNVKN